MKKISMSLLALMVLGTLAMSDVSHKKNTVVNERAKEFVASNMSILEKEIAIGHGESIETLAELLNIDEVALFSASLQAHYKSIYTTQNVKMADMLNSISATLML
ncbi:MAG: DUF3015 family protein [Sulfurimonas sp.]|jgi:hypothetical protein